MRDRFKQNNFDLLRFLFAATVMLVHGYVLSRQPQLAFLAEWLSSEVAVRAFFVVSGLLVFMSFDRTRNLAAYGEKRVRRIYPAYFTVVACAAVLLFFFSDAGAADYALGMGKYLAANLVFLNFLSPTLPGVFDGNALREINGALWTLKIEVMFYVAVPMFAWVFVRFGRLRTIAVTYALSALYVWVFNAMAARNGDDLYYMLGRQLPGQLSYFMVGALWYYYFDFFQRHAWKLAAAALALLMVHRSVPIQALEPLCLGTLVVFFGFFLYAGNFGRYGDFSYGIYILHFPVLQALVHAGVFAWSPLAALAIGCATVVGAAALLWHLVERPFLARSSHYVAAAKPRS
ncbi:MAG: acyltransferase family protein [Burkholderiales bacterium]